MFTSLAGPASGFGGAVAGELLLHAAGVDVPAESSMSLRRRQLDAAEPVRLPAGGSPLPRAVRRRMERALGRDLGVVRIHTGADAARAAEALSAHAAAVGAHVFFGAGEWQPGTPRGDRLIAHELTHVVQHLDNRLPSGGGVSDPSDPAEVEAYAAEDRVLAQLPLIDAELALDEVWHNRLGTRPDALSALLADALGDDVPAAIRQQVLVRLGEVPRAPEGRFEPGWRDSVATGLGDEGLAAVDAFLPGLQESSFEHGSSPVSAEAPEVSATAAPTLARSESLGGEPAGVGLDGLGDLLSGVLDQAFAEADAGAWFAVAQEIVGGTDGVLAGAVGAGSALEPGGIAAGALALGRTGQARPLPHREALEERFGVDLSGVHCFFGPQATQACASVQAEAFTVGNVIVFADSAPSIELVEHEVTHVIQQGGHLRRGLAPVPDRLPTTSPGDSAEREARQGTDASSTGPQLARHVDVSGTQGEVLTSVVKGAIPEGYESTIGDFHAVGDGLQGTVDGIQGSLNAATAFPIGDIGAMFGSGGLDFLDPKGFEESLQGSGDTFVEDVVVVILGVCEICLAVLDGFIGTITSLVNMVMSFVDLLKQVVQALQIIAAILFAIATALAATMFGAGAAKVLFKIAETCYDIADTISSIADQVESFIEPLKEVVEQIEAIKERIQQVAEICQIIKLCCDVFDWLTADTAEERARCAGDILGGLDLVSGMLGNVDAGRFTEFATAFWEDARPALEAELADQAQAITENVDQTAEQNVPTGPEVGEDGKSEAEGLLGTVDLTAYKASATELAASQPEGEGEGRATPDQAADAARAYREFEAEELKKHPIDQTSEDQSINAPDPAAQVQKQVSGITAGSLEERQAQALPVPEAGTYGLDNGGDKVSAVSAAEAVTANASVQPLDGSSTPDSPVDQLVNVLSDMGYPADVASVFDYLNDLIEAEHTAAGLQKQGLQRGDEAKALAVNAENTIAAMEETKAANQELRQSAQKNEQAGHEGLDFMA